MRRYNCFRQTVESTNNKFTKEVFSYIISQEKKHAGEFLGLLSELAPDEAKSCEEGYGEFEEMVAMLIAFLKRALPLP